MSTAPVSLPDLLDPAAGRLDGRVALVTGANGASGPPVARALAALGADVVLVHRGGTNADVVEALESELAAGDGAVLTVVGDVSRPGGASSVFDAAVARFDRVDVVVHLPGRSVSKPIAELTDEEWSTNVTANLDSAFLVLREAANRIADGGRIVLLSTSLTAVTVPGYGSYAPHKAGVEQLVRTAAKELGGRGITVNAVAPGPIESPFVTDGTPPERLAMVRGFSPQGRMGEWDEVAPVIAFLATERARWISAQTLRVNGAMVG